MNADKHQKLLITASSWAHVKNFHLRYLQKFHELGWEIHLGCGGVPDYNDNILCVDKIINLPFQKKIYSPSNFKAAKIIREKYQSARYDLIITHTSLAAFFTRYATRNIKQHTKIINTVHGYLFDDNTCKIKRNIFLKAE